MKKIEYMVRGYHKHAVLDHWSEGEEGNGNDYFADNLFTSDSMRGLIEELCKFLGCDDYQLNACDEIGRIDFVRMETDHAIEPTIAELAAWQRCEIKLWHATYTVYVDRVESERIDPQKELAYERAFTAPTFQPAEEC